MLIANGVFAQEFTQTIKGRIIDQQSKSPLIGVNIIMLDSKPPQGSMILVVAPPIRPKSHRASARFWN